MSHHFPKTTYQDFVGVLAACDVEPLQPVLLENQEVTSCDFENHNAVVVFEASEGDEAVAYPGLISEMDIGKEPKPFE